MNESECQFINTYLGKPREIPLRSCPGRKTKRNICWFGKTSRNGIHDMGNLQCDSGICMDDEVQLGVFNTTVGEVKPDHDWLKLTNESALIEAIGDVMRKTYSNHFRYILQNQYKAPTILDKKIRTRTWKGILNDIQSDIIGNIHPPIPQTIC
jgi:hypothetical protein